VYLKKYQFFVLYKGDEGQGEFTPDLTNKNRPKTRNIVKSKLITAFMTVVKTLSLNKKK
jgi:hypothetical protein